MDWRYWLGWWASMACAGWASANARELHAQGSTSVVAWLVFFVVPVLLMAGASVFAFKSVSAVAKRDRSLDIMADLVRELTAAGRLQNVTSTGVKFAVEFKQEGK